MKNITFLITFLFYGINLAQEPVVVIRPGEKKQRTRRSFALSENVENYDAFKFDPLRMVLGEINFAYEHRFAEKFSWEAEFGPTISNVSLFSGNVFHIGGGSEYNTVVRSGLGGLFSGAIRFYPFDESMAMNRFYISPKVKFRSYQSNLSSDVISSTSKNIERDLSFTFNAGTQLWYSQNFAIDYYLGVGLASRYYRYSYLEGFYDGNTNTQTYSWINNSNTYAQFIFTTGVKVVFGN